jgi:Molybdopterin-binding domain of aldehyde dehydrogenase
VVETSTHDIGTGTYTIFPQIAADILGIDASSVTLKAGDTDLPPAGPVYGSSSTMGTGTAVMDAAERAKAELGRLTNRPPGEPVAEAMRRAAAPLSLHRTERCVGPSDAGGTLAEMCALDWTVTSVVARAIQECADAAPCALQFCRARLSGLDIGGSLKCEDLEHQLLKVDVRPQGAVSLGCRRRIRQSGPPAIAMLACQRLDRSRPGAVLRSRRRHEAAAG